MNFLLKSLNLNVNEYIGKRLIITLLFRTLYVRVSFNYNVDENCRYVRFTSDKPFSSWTIFYSSPLHRFIDSRRFIFTNCYKFNDKVIGEMLPRG